MNLWKFGIVLGALVLGGCATNPPHSLYDWGHYESQVYVLYGEPGKISVDEQIAVLEKDAANAQAAKRALPPGFYAQLGQLYFEAGKLDLARQAFETEKALFPESTVYMDRALARLAASSAKKTIQQTSKTPS